MAFKLLHCCRKMDVFVLKDCLRRHVERSARSDSERSPGVSMIAVFLPALGLTFFIGAGYISTRKEPERPSGRLLNACTLAPRREVEHRRNGAVSAAVKALEKGKISNQSIKEGQYRVHRSPWLGTRKTASTPLSPVSSPRSAPRPARPSHPP